jgi:hypothetical protein
MKSCSDPSDPSGATTGSTREGQVPENIWPERPTCHDDDYAAQRFAQMSDGFAAVWCGPIDTDARVDPGRQSYEPFRSCSFCGSMHPEDLLTAIKAGATLGGSDWKYGWPHKFYVNAIPHVHPEREVWRGGSSGPLYRCRTCGFEPPKSAWPVPLCEHVTDRVQYAITGHYKDDIFEPVGPTVHGKWYNTHLNDLSDVAFALLAPVLKDAAGIEWHRKDGKLLYSAPHRGFQR